MTPRNTTQRDRNRNQIRRTKPPCGICGNPIDYTLPHLDPMAYVVDHVIPLNRGGTDDIDNCQAAHRSCNRTKSDRITTDEMLAWAEAHRCDDEEAVKDA